MIFIVLLRFSANRGEAGALLEAHKEWIRRGLRDGVFLLVGSLQPASGGVVLAHQASRAEIEARVAADPFVLADVVSAEILEVQPSLLAPSLQFLGVGGPR